MNEHKQRFLHYANVKPGDPLSPEALQYPRNDRRRLAAALRQLCPDLTAEEAEALSQVPPRGSPATIAVDELKALIERELPRLGAKQDDGTSWDAEPVDTWPVEPATISGPIDGDPRIAAPVARRKPAAE